MVWPDLTDGGRHHLLHAQPVRRHDGHRLALGGQQPLVSVQADREHAHRWSLAEYLDDAGQRAQLARAVEHHHDVGPEPCLAGVHRLLCLLPVGDDREQLGDPRGHRFRVVTDEREAVLTRLRRPRAWPAVRQPARPLPARPARRVGEHIDLQVVGAVHGGRLRHEPAADRARRVARARDAHHAALSQRHRYRHVGDLPEDLPAVCVLLGVGQFDRGRQLGGAQAQQQVVGIGAAALPQAAPRARGDRERGARVGAVRAPGDPLRVERVPGVTLDALLVRAVLGHPLGVGLAAVLALVHVVADQHDRAQHGHGEHVDLAHEEGHRHAQEHGDNGHQHRERPALASGRRRR